MYKNFLAKRGNNLDLLDDSSRGYILVGGQALLRLEAFDTMVDNPIEVLRTVMLDVGKALVKNLVRDDLNDQELDILQKLVRSYDSKGFKRKLSSSLRLRGSFVGRDYKIVLQQLPILLENMVIRRLVRMTPGFEAIKNCLGSLGRLISLIYISGITSHSHVYVQAIRCEYMQFKNCVLLHDGELRKMSTPKKKRATLHNTSKMHILCHITEDIIRFGSPVFFYETEKGKQFNRFIREALFRTNRRGI